MAVEPRMSKSDVKPRPQVLLVVFWRNSSALPSGLNRNRPVENLCCWPSTLPSKPA